jgi:hypothetical protein
MPIKAHRWPYSPGKNGNELPVVPPCKKLGGHDVALIAYSAG